MRSRYCALAKTGPSAAGCHAVTLILRTGSRDDVDAVLEFWRVATAEPSTTDDGASVVALLDHSPDALVVADNDGAIVGTVIAAWDGWRGTMYRLAVHPAWRRRGIATDLVAEGERRLVSHGAIRLHMIVAADDGQAQGFWASSGFERTGQSRFVKTLRS